MGLHPVLAVRCRRDLLLHHLAPMGLAAARETALLIDLDDDGPGYPGKLSLAALISEGARRRDLGPTKKGVAVLANGGADLDEALGLIALLAGGWPAVVVRIGSSDVPYPVVDVSPEFPAGWASGDDEALVIQPVGRWSRTSRADVTRLPPLRRSQVRAMLSGTIHPRWRWVRAWRRVWELPWD